MINFKPYPLPTYAAYGWDRRFNPTHAEAFLSARNGGWAIEVPKYSRRMLIVTGQVGHRVYNRLGKAVLTQHKIVRELGKRLPPHSVIDIHASDSEIVVTDVLFMHSKDLRDLGYEARMAAYWFMPKEYNKRVFFGEGNYNKMGIDLFKDPNIAKVIFKPDFVSYPTNGNAKVFNWLLMSKPGSQTSAKDVGNASLLNSRPIRTSAKPRRSSPR